jgi:PTS system cellobiose-specific IIA component
MEGTELVAFNIIASVGTARSSYIAAIDAAAEGKFEEAEQLIKEGQEAFNGGHSAHQELLVKMANGEDVTMTLLLTHAEDQLMSAEAFGILAGKFIDLYKQVKG